MPRERLLPIAAIFVVIGIVYAIVDGSWAAALVGAAALVLVFVLFRLRA